MKRTVILLSILVVAACAATDRTVAPAIQPELPVATFSIVALDPETGDLGVAVQSKFLGVGSVVPWARAGVGAIATQAWANTSYGPTGLRILDAGNTPEQTVGKLIDRDPGRETRQVGVVDAKGRVAAYTGKQCMKWAGHLTGEGFTVQGNILAGKLVLEAMAEAFRVSKADFPERLVSALKAGQAAGGDKRGRQSAALLVVREAGGYAGHNDRYIDLRVDDHPKPIEELGRILALHRKFFEPAPLPRELEKFVKEPKGSGDAHSSPRAVWEAWVGHFHKKAFRQMYELHSPAYRETNPYEAWVAALQKGLGAWSVTVERYLYSGTHEEGDRAQIALTAAGDPRPKILTMVRVDRKWYLGEK
ncbi:MAG: DUF1028 domain-containing protein [Planctomycetota bacterium]